MRSSPGLEIEEEGILRENVQLIILPLKFSLSRLSGTILHWFSFDCCGNFPSAPFSGVSSHPDIPLGNSWTLAIFLIKFHLFLAFLILGTLILISILFIIHITFSTTALGLTTFRLIFSSSINSTAYSTSPPKYLTCLDSTHLHQTSLIFQKLLLILVTFASSIHSHPIAHQVLLLLTTRVLDFILFSSFPQ